MQMTLILQARRMRKRLKNITEKRKKNSSSPSILKVTDNKDLRSSHLRVISLIFHLKVETALSNNRTFSLISVVVINNFQAFPKVVVLSSLWEVCLIFQIFSQASLK